MTISGRAYGSLCRRARMGGVVYAKISAPLLVGITIAALLGPGQAAAKPRYTKSVKLTHACRIFENFPGAGVPPRSWMKPKSGRVGLRYNVTPDQALVLDYARGEHSPKINPHWGFISRECLKEQLPKPDLIGVGGDGNDKRVDFAPAPAPTVGTRSVLGRTTLRSGPKSFVIGNLKRADDFGITSNCSGHSSTSFVLGYAPVAQRWGWVQSANLRGDPCAPHKASVSLRGLRITAKQLGRYDIQQRNHLTVCGPRGSVLVRFQESKHFPSSGITTRRAHTFRRRQTQDCQRYVFAWRVSQDLAGIGSYTMTYGAKIGGDASRVYTYRAVVSD